MFRNVNPGVSFALSGRNSPGCRLGELDGRDKCYTLFRYVCVSLDYFIVTIKIIIGRYLLNDLKAFILRKIGND